MGLDAPLGLLRGWIYISFHGLISLEIVIINVITESPPPPIDKVIKSLTWEMTSRISLRSASVEERQDSREANFSLRMRISSQAVGCLEFGIGFGERQLI